MSKLKNDYEEITASKTLKKRVDAIMNGNRRKKSFLKAFQYVAAILVISILVLNSFERIAYALSDVPVLGKIIRVVTFNRFEYKDDGYEAEIITPKIEGLLDSKLMDELNAKFSSNANALIAAFEKDVKELKEVYGEDSVHMAVKADYVTLTDNENILAIDNYVFYASGSSNTIHSFYTIDKRTGTLLTLAGLFETNADYVVPISDYILSEMIKLNDNENGLFWAEENEFNDGFDRISSDQGFYINNDYDLVICFDKYEVAAGAQGSPQFVIPSDVIKDIVSYDLLKHD